MPALTTDEVLIEEAKAVHGADLTGKTGTELYAALNGLNSAALCLSGGGIRSASFALGVMQALAVHPRGATGGAVQDPERSLLARFHYLSTVSGGGYIGSWLSAWIMRAGFPAVWNNLVRRPDGPDVDPQAVAWLRAYSNYLTPKLGLTSADTWSAIAIVLRNLILNWFVIVPVLCLALLVLKLLAVAVAWFSQFHPQSCHAWFLAAFIAGCVSLIVALRFTTQNRPTRGASAADQTQFLKRGLLPAWLSGLFFTFAFASPCPYEYINGLPAFSVTGKSMLALGVPTGIIIYFFGWITAWPQCRLRKDESAASSALPHPAGAGEHPQESRQCAWDLTAWLVGGAVYGALMALGVYLYMKAWNVGGFCVFGPGGDAVGEFCLFKPAEILLVVFAVPWALGAQLFAEMAFVAFSSYQRNSESDREWLARGAGWYILTALGWLILMLLVFVAATIAAPIYEKAWAWLTSVGTGAVTAWLAKNSKTPAKGEAKSRTGLSANVILAIVAPVFAILFVVILSAVLDQLLFGRPLVRTAAFGAEVPPEGWPAWPGGWSLPIAIVVVLVIGAVASWFVNINRFSLHSLYRNRLIRGFLGASNSAHRQPNPFTDFDVGDNPTVADLWKAPKRVWRPFHIINMALNIVSTKRLAWQERKAETFTVSPLHAGTACGQRVQGSDGIWRALGAFRPSSQYGGKAGMSLGTAMAISGAAASPNMGYNSSPPLAFLMTMFNVRLGWWLGNPVKESETIYGGEGPPFAVVPLLNEMLGQTTDESHYVYLSDGGHFENLGIYEMVRRRCGLIVVSDAGCDPDFNFDDLGNAVRKIALDLGVTIDFTQLATLKSRKAVLESMKGGDGTFPYHAVGIINYPEAGTGAGTAAASQAGEDETKAGDKGVILYIKPCFHGTEVNTGVRNYALINEAFPHEGTGDQFFSESQFESYRALGFEIMDDLLRSLAQKIGRPLSLQEICTELAKPRDAAIASDPGVGARSGATRPAS